MENTKSSTIEGKNVGKKCRTHYRGTFNDGTQKSVNIKVKHQKLTGAQVQNSKFNKDKKYIFVTFEVDA